jgi:hypothetical protein
MYPFNSAGARMAWMGELSTLALSASIKATVLSWPFVTFTA